MSKWSDPFSKRVLIGRGLDHNSLETLKSQRKNVSSDYSVLKARPSKKHWTKYNRHVILVQSDRSVSMTVRFHLFPFRTQKLSSLVPQIVRWKRRVKIGSRRLEQKTLQKKFWGVFLLFEIGKTNGHRRSLPHFWINVEKAAPPRWAFNVTGPHILLAEIYLLSATIILLAL